MNEQELIPIFFSTDDTYVPCLVVAIKSIIENSSKENNYQIIVLNTGLKDENITIISELETENVKIRFANIKDKIADIEKELAYRLRDYYSASIYYRLFIPGLFPEYKKAIYLDCDITVISDIAELYNKDLGDNVIGAVVDNAVSTNEIFKTYVKNVLGIDSEEYVNSGVLVINLEKFRKEMIEEKFLYLLCTYNFDTVAPDQDYLNVLCNGKILFINKQWNRMPIPDDEFDVSTLKLIHYNMFQKPWLYDKVLYDEYFWNYAKDTKFYDSLRRMQMQYTDRQREADATAAGKLLNHSLEVVKQDIRFVTVLTPEFMKKLDAKIKNNTATNEVTYSL